MTKTTTVISSLNDPEGLKLIYNNFSPDKLILLSEDLESNQSINDLNSLLEDSSENIEVKSVDINQLDLVESTNKIYNIIKEENNVNNKIIISLSYLDSHFSLSIYFSAVLNRDFINRVLIYDNENNQLIQLPLFDLTLSKIKKSILVNLNSNCDTIDAISNETGRSSSMIYNHIRDLRKLGFIEQDSLKITLAGRLAIIGIS